MRYKVIEKLKITSRLIYRLQFATLKICIQLFHDIFKKEVFLWYSFNISTVFLNYEFSPDPPLASSISQVCPPVSVAGLFSQWGPFEFQHWEKIFHTTISKTLKNSFGFPFVFFVIR